MNKARARILSINAILAVVIVLLGWWGWSALHPAPAKASTSTTVATVGDVQSTVSASGKVVSPGDVGVSPTVSALITHINVKVGSRVSAGQVMATLDNAALLNTLNQAKSTLATDQIQLSQAAAAVQSAKDNATSNAATYLAAVDAANKAITDANANAPLKKSSYQYAVDTAKATLDNAKQIYDSYSQFYGPNGITLSWCATLVTINSNCTTLQNDYNAYQTAQKAYDNAVAQQNLNLQSDSQSASTLQTALTNAQNAQAAGLKKDQQAIASAQASYDLMKAQMGVTVDNPTAADFTVAQAALQLAQKNYDATFVKAPVAGDVASISAVVGQMAPTASSSTVGSVSGFIVLTNVSALEVQAGYSESDAAKIQSGQDASFTFAALPNVNAAGKVLQVDLLPTTSSGATTYNVTFAITDKVPGLKPGMTATATVITGSVTNVLQVSSQAVTIRGSGAFVNLVTTSNGVEKITPTPVTVGLQGDSADQILSGLKAGDKVALRTASVSGSHGFPASGVPAGLGGAGLGGAGLGGGGGGRGFGG